MARTRWVNYYLHSGGRLTREPPGHEFTIDLQATSNVFKRGHRIVPIENWYRLGPWACAALQGEACVPRNTHHSM